MTSVLDSKRLYEQVAFGAWVGIIGNILLGVAKLSGGILGGSEALVADSVDTLSDSVTSVVVLFGAWRARRPADADHPYGHGKAEVVAARTVAVMVMIVGVVFAWRAVQKIMYPHDETPPAVWTIWFCVASILVKEGMARYKMRLGRRIKSESLIADAMNHRSDVLTSIVAVIGISAAIWMGPEWRFLDPVAAVVICLVIFGIGVTAFVRTGSALMDKTADAETIAAIREVAHAVEGVRDTEKLLTRRAGLETHVDLHVEVDPGMTVGAAHAIASAVERVIRQKVQGVTHVTVHIEPYFPGDH